MNKVIIGVGSNIDPEQNIATAKEKIARQHKLIAESPLRWTEPMGDMIQPRFLNGALVIETQCGREELDAQLKQIESDLGRDHTKKDFGPRTIDLDIVVWNESIVHNDFYRRDFLKKSVLGLQPNLKE